MGLLSEIRKRNRYKKNLAGCHERIQVDVALLTSVFFDDQGGAVIPGGAERYVIDLLRIIHERYGFSTAIFQRSSNNELWHRQYDSIDVYGLPVKGKSNYLNYFFHNFVQCQHLTIYNTLDLARPLCNRKSIGISHGVYWDNPTRRKTSKMRMIDSFLAGLINVDRVVSVDTNTINFFRGFGDANLVTSKCRYIPNYADETFFSNRYKGGGNPIVITYPRRVYDARGYDFFDAAARYALSKYDNLEFHIIGQIHDEAHAAKVASLCQQYPGKIFARTVNFADMYLVYRDSDIVIVPTKFSEGTSLSVIEAMASNCCVITTNVGGLPNLIIDGFNGLLCEPLESAIIAGLDRLLGDEALRRTICENARATAEQAFSKQLWDTKWLSVVEEVMGCSDKS